VHILWLKTEMLHPLDKGGRIRTYHMLRELRREHRITYLTLDDGDSAPDAPARAREYCTSLQRVTSRVAAKGSPEFYLDLARNLLSPLPYAVWKYRSPRMRELTVSLTVGGDVDLVVCDFLAPAVNLAPCLRVPTLLFQHNVESRIWQRHAEVATHPAVRMYLREQARRMAVFECAECRRFDHVVAVSPDDRDCFAEQFGVRHVSDVATGVDTEYFHLAEHSAARANMLLFTGSMDWMPNEDAMVYFTEAIAPRLRTRFPDLALRIAGRNPTPTVRSLAGPGVEVTGTVPDIRPHLEQASVVVVPLRVGGGTRLKIFEAMAMGKPIVSTSIGAEGLPVRHEEHLLVADTPEDFAGAVRRLLEDPGYATALGQRGAALVRSRFGWRQVAQQFADTCGEVAQARRRPQLTAAQ